MLWLRKKGLKRHEKGLKYSLKIKRCKHKGSFLYAQENNLTRAWKSLLKHGYWKSREKAWKVIENVLNDSIQNWLCRNWYEKVKNCINLQRCRHMQMTWKRHEISLKSSSEINVGGLGKRLVNDIKKAWNTYWIIGVVGTIKGSFLYTQKSNLTRTCKIFKKMDVERT